MLFPWDVNDGVVRAYRVEGRISERQCDEVGANPNSCGHVMLGEAELYLGKVDSDDAGTSGELLPASRTRARGGRRTTRSSSSATSGESRRRDDRYAAAMRLYDSRTWVLGSISLESSSLSVKPRYGTTRRVSGRRSRPARAGCWAAHATLGAWTHGAAAPRSELTAAIFALIHAVTSSAVDEIEELVVSSSSTAGVTSRFRPLNH